MPNCMKEPAHDRGINWKLRELLQRSMKLASDGGIDPEPSRSVPDRVKEPAPADGGIDWELIEHCVKLACSVGIEPEPSRSMPDCVGEPAPSGGIDSERRANYMKKFAPGGGSDPERMKSYIKELIPSGGGGIDPEPSQSMPDSTKEPSPSGGIDSERWVNCWANCIKEPASSGDSISECMANCMKKPAPSGGIDSERRANCTKEPVPSKGIDPERLQNLKEYVRNSIEEFEQKKKP